MNCRHSPNWNIASFNNSHFKLWEMLHITKSRHSPESISLQQRQRLWQWGSWGWAGSVCRRPLSKHALCLSEWPADGKAQWLLPQTLCLGTWQVTRISHGSRECREVTKWTLLTAMAFTSIKQKWKQISDCLSFDFLNNHSSDRLNIWLRCCLGPKEVQHLQRSFLDNYPFCALTSSSVNCRGAEGLPDNRLTDVGRNEQWDSWTKTIALLKQLIQQQHNHSSHKQLWKNNTDSVNWETQRQVKIFHSCEIHFIEKS